MPLRARTYIGSSVRSTPSSVTRPESGRGQSHRHVERRGLAGAVGAEQADDLTGIDFEADASNDGAATVGLGEFVCAEGRSHHLRRASRGTCRRPWSACGLRCCRRRGLYRTPSRRSTSCRSSPGSRRRSSSPARRRRRTCRRPASTVRRVPVTVRLSTIAVTAPSPRGSSSAFSSFASCSSIFAGAQVALIAIELRGGRVGGRARVDRNR